MLEIRIFIGLKSFSTFLAIQICIKTSSSPLLILSCLFRLPTTSEAFLQIIILQSQGLFQPQGLSIKIFSLLAGQTPLSLSNFKVF